jgi:hypothetical protein
MSQNTQIKPPLIIKSSSSSLKEEEDSVDSAPTTKPDSNASEDIDSNTKQYSCNYDLEADFKNIKDNKKDSAKNKCNDENYYSTECNKFILKKELVERNCLNETDDAETSFSLYPNLNDANFNIKIAEKKEFNDTKYDGEIHKNIKEHADMLAKADFELSPHQAFVKNFLSFQTPYNSLLLYHGLGSGKTCSAIGVSEEMRDYLKQMGISKRIIIVASENVQDNFKLQLFDKRKLKLVDGLWNIKACTGNKLLKEINPMSMKGIPMEKVVSQINALINSSYLFLGYGQFANYIIKTMNADEEGTQEEEPANPSKKNKIQILKEKTTNTLSSQSIKRIKHEFDGRLIIIDEVHNIRKTDDNENKIVATYLELLVKAAKNMRLLFLSATPMYNSYKEIIWLLNIMNMNDRRGKIDVSNVFDANGNFKAGGEELLIRKATGYVSFVRGENPYTFPYRVYPNEFAREHTFLTQKYPTYQMNHKKIKDDASNRILSLYLNTFSNCDSCGNCQACAYKYIITDLRTKNFNITTKEGTVRQMPTFENMESFGYTLLQIPLESLIISYPIDGLKQSLARLGNDTFSEELEETTTAPRAEAVVSKVDEESLEKEKEANNMTAGAKSSADEESSASSVVIGINVKDLTGRKGLERMMSFVDSKTPPEKGSFEYKKGTIDKYGAIFSRDLIGKYSSKIKSIIDNIISPEGVVSEGIILIYSQYIDSGLIPMALALEEIGFTRYGKDVKPLFKNRPTELVDVTTMLPPKNKKNFMPARYSMITGDPRLSPDNDVEVKGLTDDTNRDGHKIKVVLISRAGSEGIDLKFIRQVHILEPWYNMNRIDQIIGRAVRNFSHKDLPFEKRNVQIFMYGTILENNKEEAADLYVYRTAEYKAIQIGKISRVLKETAVDCIINHDQTNFTQKIMSTKIEGEITQELSTGMVISNFKIGDAPYSAACDYMERCEYNCRPNKVIDEANLNEDTYNENFILINSEKILQRIRMLMKEEFFYKKDVLLNLIRAQREYPYIQIFAALTQLIEDANEYITDKYGRTGRLINIDNYYLFQPLELRYKNISIFDRVVPIDYKHNMIDFKIKQNIVKPVIDTRHIEEEIVAVEAQEIDDRGQQILDELKKNLDLSFEYAREQKRVPIKDDTWNKHYGVVMRKIAKEFKNVKEFNADFFIEFLVDHFLDLLLFEEKVLIMNYLYSLKSIKKNTYVWFAKKYFENSSIQTSHFLAIILYNLNKKQIMILKPDNKWVKAEPSDEREFNTESNLVFNKTQYNKIIGFVGYEKNNKYLVFKTKDLESKRDTGARCDESGKIKTLDMLNKIVDDVKYTKDTTKGIKDDSGNVIQEAVTQTELCVLQEFLLRYYNKIQKDEKSWFLTPEMALYFNLYTVIVK